MASKRQLKRKECGDKVRYETQTLAVASNKRQGMETHTYKCRFGNHWHIGHQRMMKMPGLNSRRV